MTALPCCSLTSSIVIWNNSKKKKKWLLKFTLLPVDVGYVERGMRQVSYQSVAVPEICSPGVYFTPFV
jgi:hypothetical protein